MASLPDGPDERKLLWMMGWETANIHLGGPAQRKAILRELARRKDSWLTKAAESHVRSNFEGLAAMAQSIAVAPR